MAKIIPFNVRRLKQDPKAAAKSALVKRINARFSVYIQTQKGPRNEQDT